MKFEVFFDEEAEVDLDGLTRMIESLAGERVASRFIGRIRDLCRSLASFRTVAGREKTWDRRPHACFRQARGGQL